MAAADETIGVTAVARILARLAERPGETVAELAARLDIGRSTAFAVAAELDASGLVERDAAGRLFPGPAAGRLSFAHHGYGAIVDTAQALLPVLRDDTDASASLRLSDIGGDVAVLERRAAWDSEGAAARVEMLIGESADGVSARLCLALRPRAGEAELRSASGSLQRVAAALRVLLPAFMRRG